MSVLRAIGFLLIVMGAVSTYTRSAIAQQRLSNPSTQEIINRLEPKERTRSLRRGITVQGGTTREPPSIDLQINFEFGSAKLTTDAQLLLKNLARALKDDALRSYEFEIAGHTDAVGSAESNLQLSKNRAQTVKEFLVFYYDISPGRLHTIGYGEFRPLDQGNPNAATNRRVEIVNKGLGSKGN